MSRANKVSTRLEYNIRDYGDPRTLAAWRAIVDLRKRQGDIETEAEFEKLEQALLAARKTVAVEKATATRKRRRELKIYDLVNQINAGKLFGPTECCLICAKKLTDRVSIERGVGPDCWQKYVVGFHEWLAARGKS